MTEFVNGLFVYSVIEQRVCNAEIVRNGLLIKEEGNKESRWFGV